MSPARRIALPAGPMVFILSLLVSTPAAASPAEPLVHSVDAELRAAAGGGSLGLWGRASHLWPTRGPTLLAGLALGLYAGSEEHRTPGMHTTGAVQDLHLDAHLAPVFRPGPQDRFFVETGLWLGIYGYRSKGSWAVPAQEVREETAVYAVLPDVGARLALGWTLPSGWQLQLSLNDSLRRVAGAQGVIGGLATLEADAKLSAGLGLTVPLGSRP